MGRDGLAYGCSPIDLELVSRRLDHDQREQDLTKREGTERHAILGGVGESAPLGVAAKAHERRLIARTGERRRRDSEHEKQVLDLAARQAEAHPVPETNGVVEKDG